AHARGVIHRDVKPRNLFLPKGQIDEVKVLDFGLAGLCESTVAITRTGAIMGTPAYIAPEQAERGAKGLGATVDVFALGCVLFECLSGRPAFSGEPVLSILAKIMFEEVPRLDSLRRDVPAPLVDLVARMLEKDPHRRPKDGAAVVLALSEGAAPATTASSAA